ncbi:hypothetical protein ACF059_18165 [Streptomyces sp. NPDC016562]|uniref:hypothetical protein n=1 Tax=Streptomyces sp. NPDC016562 TaxID=3364966 RepID=UPI0036FFD975
MGITAALLGVQGVLHLVFSESMPTGRSPLPAPSHTHAHHHMPGMDMDMSAGMSAGMDMGPGADMAGHGGLGMIAAHVLAGLLCAAWLAWGEAAVFRLARVLGAAALHAARPLSRALVLVRARPAALPTPPAFRAPYHRPRRLRGAVHAHAVVRRGPPVAMLLRATAPGRPARA